MVHADEGHHKVLRYYLSRQFVANEGRLPSPLESLTLEVEREVLRSVAWRVAQSASSSL